MHLLFNHTFSSLQDSRTRVPITVQGFSNGKKGKCSIMHLFISFLGKMTDQDVKYLEDLQEEFDFRYKTIQSLGKSLYTNF